MTAPAETMTAMAPLGVNGSGLVPSLTMVPLLSRTVIVPRVSLFRQPASAGDPHVVLVLFLKLFDTPYHSLSPSPSRKSSRPSVFQGRRPSRTACPVVPAALPQDPSATPSLSVCGHGRSPGRYAPTVRSTPAA